jgi:hypothetical protein
MSASVFGQYTMISKRQKWTLWSSFTVLVLGSGISVLFAFAMFRIVPMALNDSSVNFSNIADEDRWRVYREAQSLILPIDLIMLGIAILWAALAGFTIWKLSRKDVRDSN